MNEKRVSIDLAEAVQAAAVEERREIAQHPEPEDLVGYQARRLTGDEAARIADHLALCQRCAHLVLDLSAFPEIPLRESSLALDPEQHDEDLLTLLARLPEDDAVPLSLPRRYPNRKSLWRFTIAASVAAAVVGLGLWLAGFPPPLGRARDGLVQGALLDLYPTATSRRGPGVEPATPEPLPGGSGPVVLIMNSSVEAGSFTSFEVEIHTAAKTLLHRQRVAPDERGTFTLVVERAVLPPGAYEVLLLGSSAARERIEVARYEVEIRYADGA